MRKTIIVAVALAVIGLLAVTGFRGQSGSSGADWQDKIEWQDPSVSLSDITAGGKPVYLFVTTEWCTYCTKMKKETFTDPNVQALLNDLFVPIIVNPELDGTANFLGENMSYRDAARHLGVSGYPANFFIDPDGKVLGGRPGYIGAAEFAELAEFVGDGHYSSMSFTDFRKLSADKRR
jgi:thioredoxin-related protein